MEIKKLVFEKKETEIKEYYVDESGKTRERTKKVMLPTGNIVLQKPEPTRASDPDTTP